MDRSSKTSRKRINITLPGEVHEVGKRLAAADRRDFSHFIEVLLEQRLREMGGALARREAPTPQEVAS